MFRKSVKLSIILSILILRNLQELSARLCETPNMVAFRQCLNGTNYDDTKNSLKTCLQRNNCTEFMGIQLGAKSGLGNFIDQAAQCSKKGIAKFVDYLNVCDENNGLNLNVTSADVLNFMKHEAAVSSGNNAMWGSTTDTCQQSAQKCLKFTETGAEDKFQSCGKTSFQDCSWKETFPTICNCSVEIMQTRTNEILDDFELCMVSTGKQSLIKNLRQKYETSVQTNSKSLCKKETTGGDWSKSNRWSAGSDRGSDARLNTGGNSSKNSDKLPSMMQKSGKKFNGSVLPML